MCGIVGFVGSGGKKELQNMIDGVRHRGPDDEGVFLRGEVGLGHTRLSIIDISENGHQPMSTPDGSVTIVFNGEIFNFKDLRDELQSNGFHFKSSSDTEVILALYLRYGTGCFEKLIGQFAIALFDFSENVLYLARDRMGEKPLYWTIQNGTLLFASEMKALLASDRIKKKIDLSSLNQYLLYDYVPTPSSIMRGIYKLEPATVLKYANNKITKQIFWTPPRAIIAISEDQALQKLDDLLKKSVSRQLISDVPLGVFLSGGLDSSTIAYYAQRTSSRLIDTFSIGFEEASFDESRYAREVAKHLGSHHHEEILRAQDSLDLISEIPNVFSEPVADASVLPTLLLSRFARKTVTVALGGDGGDELFAGYPTFFAEKYFSLYERLPQFLKNSIARFANSLPARHTHFPVSYALKKFISSSDTNPLHRHLEWLGAFATKEREMLAGSTLRNIVSSADVFASVLQYENQIDDAYNRLLWVYARMYLMDQVLVKVDRASMRFALETRAPFLDHTVVDFIFSLPYSMKYNRGVSKYLLKKLMGGKLPSHIIERKKKGFGIPLAQWLTGPLRGLCEELLSRSAIQTQGLFDEAYVERIKNDHMSMKRDNRKELWNLMVFQLWYKKWM